MDTPNARFTVVVTLGASPSPGEPTLREAFFHTETLSEALAVVGDLRAGSAKGLWLEHFTAKNIIGKVSNWWQIRAIDY